MATDSRLTEIEQDREEQLNKIDQEFGEMISSSDEYYNQQIEASKEYAEQQQAAQQAQTDFEVEKIEQQKETARQDYVKEQSGAYADWQKQSNRYGVNAEQMAAAGLSRTGFSETSQVSMYNTYQNRVATARTAFTQAVTNYDNAMTTARLQNDALLAEIAAEAHREQAELALQAFQYKNSLLMQQESTKQAWTSIFDQRYAQMLDQINTERALAEQQRQANLSHWRWQQEQTLAAEQQQAWLDALNGGDSTDTKSSTNILSNPTYQSTANTLAQTAGTVSAYSDGVNFLKKNGLASYAAGLVPQQEYIRKTGGSANDYVNYLRGYLQKAVFENRSNYQY